MKPILMDMEELSDSARVYSERPHPFYIVFIYLVLGLLASAILFLYYFKMDTKVTASGILRQVEQPYVVSCSVDGFVKGSNIEEGKYVQSGELLAELSVQGQDKNVKISAEKDGYLTANTEIGEGSAVEKGETLCEILPKESGAYYAELFITNEDIGKIKEGNTVRMEMASYPASEYGYITGKIQNISPDSRRDSGSGQSYYIAKVSCEDIFLKTKDGREGKLKNGMLSQAGSIVGEERMLDYIIKKID